MPVRIVWDLCAVIVAFSGLVTFHYLSNYYKRWYTVLRRQYRAILRHNDQTNHTVLACKPARLRVRTLSVS